jgi:hypothetical protein
MEQAVRGEFAVKTSCYMDYSFPMETSPFMLAGSKVMKLLCIDRHHQRMKVKNIIEHMSGVLIARSVLDNAQALHPPFHRNTYLPF